MKRIVLLTAIMAFSFIGSANSAVVSIHIKTCSMVVNGEFDKATYTEFVSVYNAFGTDKALQSCSGKVSAVLLNSGGGDVEAAIKIGEFIRSKRLSTIVSSQSSCASACVLTLLGGVERTVVGDVGLHRPYINKYSGSEAESRSGYEKTNKIIFSYLRKMNITESLLGAMNTIPPGEVKWITDYDQLTELNIRGSDPIYADERDSANARKYNISKQEYYKRQQRIDSVCSEEKKTIMTSNSIYSNCVQEVLKGRR